MSKNVVIKGAREHNLKDIDVQFPRDKLVVITGLSGSGKSTLAFDTIYAEGQRRYVESLSAYARQFLGMMNKPDVDSIDGLSPAISIEQKTTSKNPRSTVGTVTEIYDYLRLLFARIGIPHCPKCGKRIKSQTADMITDQVMKLYKGQKIMVLAPVIRSKKGTYEKLFETYKKQGFARVRVDKVGYSLDDDIRLDRYVKHDIEIIVDRIKVTERKRVQESVETSLQLAEGFVIIAAEDDEKLFSSHAACVDCGINFEELQPRMFSFNSPYGACSKCSGLGFMQRFDPELIMPDKYKSLAEGGVKPWSSRLESWRLQSVASVADHYGFDLFTPIEELDEDHIDIILYGTDENIRYKYNSKSGSSSYTYVGDFEGVIPQLERLYKQTESEYRRQEMEKFMRNEPCPACKGRRLKPKILAVTINDKSIIDVTDMSIKDSKAYFDSLQLTEKEKIISKQVLKEINSRLTFLIDVGLDYLTMSRTASTLSGGEAQRIRLATQIGSNLVGVMYILDEPSIGLHQRNNHKLIRTLKKLQDLGNTVIVVEHDAETMLHADHVIDIGPGAGVHGGKIVAQGTPKQIMSNTKSLTGQYLSGKKSIPLPKKRRPAKECIEIKGARHHNLKNIDVRIPINVLTLVTGVSGSGKSSLINETLYPSLMKKLHNSREKPGAHDDIIIKNSINKVISVDQSPIGRTPRSNPATYTKVFDDIRSLFAATKEARMRGYAPGRFSFNVRGGRCENCRGDGLIKIEMNFLPDIYVECEQCKATRYNKETLEVHYKGKNISEVLDMTVEEALDFFEHIPSLKRKLQTLFDVGLGYIKLGQSAVTLSGGEAQRVKLSRELGKANLGHTLYILDEPTTGLHFDDIKKLLKVLNRLVDKGGTVIVIEHNMDVIKTADHIIDLGPEGGDGGGYVIATGTPEEIVENEKSFTGEYLKKELAPTQRVSF